MKLIHLSDTHLGYRGQGIESLVADPWRPGIFIRQREADLMQGFIRAIDWMLLEPPDVVVHSGNLFESARPTAHLLDFAMTQLRRLTDAGIPVILIEGSHDSPRDRAQGHALQVLGHLPRVQIACERAERVQVGSIVLHLFPHRALLDGASPEQAECDPKSHNVLVAHGIANGLRFYQTGRPAAEIAVSRCATRFEYIALGHAHRFGQVPGATTAFYAGATAMVTNADFRPGHTFGCIHVIIDESDESAVVVKRQELATRPMHAYGLDDAEGMTATNVLTALERQVGAVPPQDAYCQVIVERLDPLTRRTLSVRAIEELFPGAAGLVVSLQAREQRWDAVRQSLIEGGDITTRFQQLVSQMDGDELFHKAVNQLGSELLERAAAMTTDADLLMGKKDEEVGEA